MLDDGIVHILATDAHETKRRPPLLAEGRDAAERWVGAQEADLLVMGRPQAIIDNLGPEDVPAPPALRTTTYNSDKEARKRGWLTRFFLGG